jgi:hypothetical protein
MKGPTSEWPPAPLSMHPRVRVRQDPISWRFFATTAIVWAYSSHAEPEQRFPQRRGAEVSA